MSWVPLRNHSYYSLLKSPTKPVRLAERAVQSGFSSIALTDEGSLAGIVPFIKALSETCQCGHHKNSHGDKICYGNNKKCTCINFEKAKIKPILGSDVRLKNKEGQPTGRITLLAKNLAGWKKLVSLTSEANKQENIYEEKAYITLEDLSKFIDGNIIGISGSEGTELANTLIGEPNKLYFAKTYDDARALTNKDLYKKTIDLSGGYKEIFGNGNFYLEAQLFDNNVFVGTHLLTEAMRTISRRNHIDIIATNNSFYAYPEDSDDQRLLLCSSLQTTYNEIGRRVIQSGQIELNKFLKSQNYYLPPSDIMEELHEENEISNTIKISDQCESYNILSKPILPIFDCPNGKSPDDYLKELCIKGWKQKIHNKVNDNILPAYKDQIKEELRVMSKAKLSSYFLIVEDYCRWAREVDNQLLGPGRGSAAGSLIAYLTNITKVDPIKYDLMFERFYNDGRNTEDRTSLPDIDVDFENRDNVIAYVRGKYGFDKVSQMITFARIQGKAALKEVFRTKFSDIPFEEVNKITDNLPDEAAISDKLQEMKEAGEEASIIMWALESNAKALKPFCHIDDNGKLQGEYSPTFRQAIRLEGTKKSQGKHPSGLVISNTPLADLVPMVYDKGSKQLIVGLEMEAAESVGLCKFDILGLNVLSKLHSVAKFLAGEPMT